MIDALASQPAALNGLKKTSRSGGFAGSHGPRVNIVKIGILAMHGSWLLHRADARLQIGYEYFLGLGDLERRGQVTLVSLGGGNL